MNIALVLAFLFYIGSSVGWILELFYRRIVSTKKWINPGFLTGPYLPIYGIGLCMLFLLSLADLSFIEDKTCYFCVFVLYNSHHGFQYSRFTHCLLFSYL